MMDDANRKIDLGTCEPAPPDRPELWSGSVWVVGPLMLGLAAALSASGSGLRSLVAILIFLVLLGALAHFLKGKSWYWQARHLYNLKVMSCRTGRAPRAATVPVTPDFGQLDAHFPSASTAHHFAWEHFRPGQSGATEADRALWQKSLADLEDIRTATVLPGTCYRCRRWIWLYRSLAKLPHRA